MSLYNDKTPRTPIHFRTQECVVKAEVLVSEQEATLRNLAGVNVELIVEDGGEGGKSSRGSVLVREYPSGVFARSDID